MARMEPSADEMLVAAENAVAWAKLNLKQARLERKAVRRAVMGGPWWHMSPEKWIVAFKDFWLRATLMSIFAVWLWGLWPEAPPRVLLVFACGWVMAKIQVWVSRKLGWDKIIYGEPEKKASEVG